MPQVNDITLCFEKLMLDLPTFKCGLGIGLGILSGKENEIEMLKGYTGYFDNDSKYPFTT